MAKKAAEKPAKKAKGEKPAKAKSAEVKSSKVKSDKVKPAKVKKTTAKAASKSEDFRAKSADELNDQLTGMKKEQFNLRFQRANGQVDNTGRIRVLRRSIARIQTVLTEQRRAAQTKG
jgi:large subunit ribosomal protein L29